MAHKKTCNKCNETKPLTEFHNNKAAPDGKQYRCKVCMKEEGKRFRAARPTYYFGDKDSYFNQPENRKKFQGWVDNWRKGTTTKVYVIEFPNRKIYVGSTTQNIKARIAEHIENYKGYKEGNGNKSIPLLYRELDKMNINKVGEYIKKHTRVIEEWEGRDRSIGRSREASYIAKLDMKGYITLNIQYSTA